MVRRLRHYDHRRHNLLRFLRCAACGLLESPGSCNSLSVLTNNLLVSGGQGCLFLWDISKGKVLRVIPLNETGCSVFIHQLCIVRNTAVVCDFGEQLQVVHFPTVLQKIE
ncbi:Sterol regulatory element-binding protein cleavage-activating protein [Lamellibrachia satsuma]|nr:Sterol regulatory element-binding protein cleavage-activating protein [Lamellibrachia satsuma]